jgi:hypothetical protein
MLEVRLLLAMQGLDERRASLQRLAGAFRGGLLLEGVHVVLEMVDEWDKMIAQQGNTGGVDPALLPDAAPREAPPESAASKHVAEMSQRLRDVLRLWAAFRLHANGR